MATDYGGIRTGLEPGDIAGIQAIYGARTLDGYQSQGIGLGLGDPIDVSSNLATSNQAVISGVSLASIGSTEYYSFVAPSYASGTLQVTAAASNISMLSPQVSIYNASGTLLAQASNPSAWSDNVTASIPAVVPGQRYYMAVTGDTGLTSTRVPTSSSSHCRRAHPRTRLRQLHPLSCRHPALPLLSLHRSSRSRRRRRIPVHERRPVWVGSRRRPFPISSFNSGWTVEYFDFQSGAAGAYQINAPGASIQVFNARGRLIAQGTNQVNVSNSRAGTAFYLKLRPATSPPVATLQPVDQPQVTRWRPFARRRDLASETV